MYSRDFGPALALLAAILAPLAGCASPDDAPATPARARTPVAELQRGYVPAARIAPLAPPSQARVPEVPTALDPAQLRPDQPENVVPEKR